MALVYKHIRKDTNEIFYIGLGKNKYRINSKSGRNQYWHNIVNKVGYITEIIKDDISWKSAQQLEIKLIKKYGRKDLNEGLLVNMTDGGEGSYGVIRSKETRRKISDSRIGIKLSDSHKKNISNGLLGRVVSDSTKEKIRMSNIGKKRSKETCKRLSESHMGNIVSKEHLIKWTRNKNNSKSVINIKTDEEFPTIKKLWKTYFLNLMTYKVFTYRLKKGIYNPECAISLSDNDISNWIYK